MQVLKQSTAATILVGPVLDADGAAYTSAVIGDFNLTKNGSTAALAAAATATHSHNGMYLIQLTTGNTDTLGRLDVSMNNTSYGMTNHRYEVLSANQFDALVTNGSVTPAAIADAVWDEPYSQHTTAGTFGKLMDILRKSNLTIDGTVSNAITPTTLTFSSNVSATTSAYAHAVLLFVSGPLAGENSPIVSYTSTNGVFVLEEPLTAAPSNGDEFVVIAGSHVHAIADIAAGVLASINGSGARTVTITVDDGTNPLQNALVRVTNGGDTYVVGTNVSGVATFNLDDATWIVSITKGGYSFAGASLVVDGTETVTYSMSLVVITPSSPSLVTGYWTVLDETGSAAASVVVTIKARQPLRGGAGIIHDAGERTATSNGSGLVQFTNLIPGWRYAVVANDDYVADFVVPADAVTSVELGSIVARLP